MAAVKSFNFVIPSEVIRFACESGCESRDMEFVNLPLCYRSHRKILNTRSFDSKVGSEPGDFVAQDDTEKGLTHNRLDRHLFAAIQWQRHNVSRNCHSIDRQGNTVPRSSALDFHVVGHAAEFPSR